MQVDREIQRIIYRLKYQFGRKVLLLQPIGGSQSIATGDLIRDFWITKIPHCIELPKRTSQAFIYDLAYIAAGKNFTTGGYFDRNTLWYLLDTAELRYAKPLDLSDYLWTPGSKIARVTEIVPTSTPVATMVRVAFTNNDAMPNIPSYFVFDTTPTNEVHDLLGGFSGSGDILTLVYRKVTYSFNLVTKEIAAPQPGPKWIGSDRTGLYTPVGGTGHTLRVRSLR